MNINNLLQETISEAQKINIPIAKNINPNVAINNRAKGRFGRCKRTSGKYNIELSAFLLQAQEESVKEVLAHEVLHICPECLNHGKTWKRYAEMMNNRYGYSIARTNTCDNLGIKSPKQKNYIIECQGCRAKITRERKSKLIENVNNYKCGKCGGKLLLINGN